MKLMIELQSELDEKNEEIRILDLRVADLEATIEKYELAQKEALDKLEAIADTIRRAGS